MDIGSDKKGIKIVYLKKAYGTAMKKLFINGAILKKLLKKLRCMQTVFARLDAVITCSDAIVAGFNALCIIISVARLLA